MSKATAVLRRLSTALDLKTYHLYLLMYSNIAQYEKEVLFVLDCRRLTHTHTHTNTYIAQTHKHIHNTN